MLLLNYLGKLIQRQLTSGVWELFYTTCSPNDSLLGKTGLNLMTLLRFLLIFYCSAGSRKSTAENIYKGCYTMDASWNSVSKCGKDLIRKMLVVKPNERISIRDILKHPWLDRVSKLFILCIKSDNKKYSIKCNCKDVICFMVHLIV